MNITNDFEWNTESKLKDIRKSKIDEQVAVRCCF